MLIEFVYSYVQLTEFAVFRLGGTGRLVLGELLSVELRFAVFAGLFGMEILVVLFQVVDIDHLVALLTPFDVSSAVREVAVDFGLGKLLPAVFAFLHWFRHYLIYDVISNCGYGIKLP